MRLTWIEINKKALLNNIEQIKKRFSKKIKFNAVVKSNAYGHGLFEVVESIKQNVDYFSVYDFEDAIKLRNKGIKNSILVLGRISPNQMQIAIDNDIDVTVSTFDILRVADKRLRMHICVDTGMGRDGFVDADKKEILNLLSQKSLNVQGLYMHFASADENAFNSYTKKQTEGLLNWHRMFKEIGLKPILHKGSSCSAFIFSDEELFDMARVGISLYGLWPSNEMKMRYQDELNLKPVLSWKARIVEVKFLPQGSSVSYGCTHILQRDSKIAILPIGYFDGIFRISSNLGKVLLNGLKVSQIGRVTMNMIVLDVTDIEDVKVGDVATIIGKDVSAQDWSYFAQTSNYEIVTRINSTIKRVIT